MFGMLIDVLLHMFQIGNVYASSVAQGISSSIFTTSILDLSEAFDVTLSEVSLLRFTQSVAAVIGALASGPLYSYVNMHYLLVGATVLHGVSYALVPVCGDIRIAHVLFALQGLSLRFSEAGSYLLLMAVHKSQWISTIVQGYHLMFAVGAGVGPLIARPFISDRASLTNRTISSRNPFSSPFPSTPAQSSALYEIHRNAPVVPPTPAPTPVPTTATGLGAPLSPHPLPRPSRVFIPFAILAFLTILIATCFYLAHRWANGSGKPRPPTRHSLREWALTLLCACHAFLYVHTFVSVLDFLSIYGVLKGMTRADSLLLISGLMWSCCCFRLVPVVLSVKLTPANVLFLADTALVAAAGAMYAVGHKSHAHLWYCSVLLGAAFASVYGSANAWLISKVRLSYLQTCVVVSAAALGAVLPSLLVGRWIEERPGIFPVVPLVSAGLLACIMVAMLLAARVIPKDSDQLDEEKSSTTQLSHKSSKSSVYSYWAYE
ncbi:uncharacterized protein LOC111263303 isoform X1 [Varroa jacobsoni]|uniref:Uncharacterized protein n=1 Tax=Varroa destructor TaxID=109461 RepID=A0A7M7J7A5_VARDE|nr:uncharacterized protein LOC111244733 isoform X2 [Varroa destructor]XP_022693988.1 uncharacterized protein LOC111263303 isoform X1 [Varroa jacobsoni]